MIKGPGEELDITQVVREAQPRHGKGDAPRLVVAAGGPPRTYRLSGTVTIGRGLDATVQLLGAGVSRLHARIIESGDDFFIEDLDSKNGTFVNGARIDRQALTIGDEIRIGQDGLLLFTRVTLLEDHLVEQQKMEAIGRLSAGVAHEFNNLMAIVIASLEYLKTLPDDFLSKPDVAQSLNDAITAAGQAAVVTRGLLSFSKPAKGEVKPVDVKELLESVIQLVRRTFERNITIELETESGLAVSGDSGLLFQAVLNLCLNARDAMPEGGTLRIVAAGDDEDVKGPRVRISVSDTGIGMTAQEMERAFEPFFTSKEAGRGTGLGLALVYGVVKTHGGSVSIDSEKDRGSTFTVTLPRSTTITPEYSRRLTHTVRVHPPKDRARVLLVDDEPLVRRSYARVIERAGYETTVARDGLEALALYRAPDASFGVVVLDLNMPGLSGAQTFAELKAHDPKARVVVLSGYADREREQLLAQGAVAVLGKPCTMEKLTETIAYAIGSA